MNSDFQSFVLKDFQYDQYTKYKINYLLRKPLYLLSFKVLYGIVYWLPPTTEVIQNDYSIISCLHSTIHLKNVISATLEIVF